MKNAMMMARMAAMTTFVVSATFVRADHHEGGGRPESHATEAAKPLCPVMGRPVNFAISTATEEGPVYFCCNRCDKKLRADPAKYNQNLVAQGIQIDWAKVEGKEQGHGDDHGHGHDHDHDH